jgi:hypothetical protein
MISSVQRSESIPSHAFDEAESVHCFVYYAEDLKISLKKQLVRVDQIS